MNEVGTEATRAGDRYGCFLPDLTGLANDTSTSAPAGAYGDVLPKAQLIVRCP